MKRVYCLYRVSTLGQVEKDDIPMQRQACHAFAEKQGWQIIAEFSEKGVSGFKQSAEQREALVAIKQAAILKKFDVLLVFMFDRLGRRDDETPFVVEWFVKNGIAVWSVMEGEQRFENHVDKLLNYIRFWQSSGESIKTALRTRVRMEQLIQENGYVGGTAPYDLTVANNSNVALENFYLHDQFPTDCSTAKTITTGTYNTRLNYQITYKTNYNDYRVLATNLLSTNNYAFDLSAVQLMQGEVVTDVRLEFGKVPAGFASVVKPTVTVQASASLANGYQVVNRVDAGGQYMSQWETGRAAWITLIVRLNEPTLPKTGY